jgi:FkbM family methyltransferase
VVARTPASGLIPFASENVIAKGLWETGEFEREELITAARFALPGSCAIDVGANVGLFAVELSRAVGPTGRVLAIEPMTSTVEQLRSSLASNECHNVEVVVAAAGAVNGEVELQVALDPAHHSIATEMLYGQVPVRREKVRGVTLDEVWADAGRPQVSFVKIDVEGAEEAVLRGALAMIATARPTMIVEVFDRSQVGSLVGLLPDYEAVVVPGFIWWNLLFRPAI